MRVKDALRPTVVSFRSLVVAAVAIFLACSIQAADQRDHAPSARRARKPNIIFILADDLGYGDLGCYGQKKIKTPILDKLAADGLRFTQCYAGSTVCAPSRSALMTGQHTGHTRIRGNARFPLQPEDVTVAEVLKSAGYQTALFGKWGLGEAGTAGSPIRKGFDEFFGYFNQRHAHNYYPTYLWRDERKVPLRNEVANEDAEGAGVAIKRLDYSHDLVTREALDFVDRHGDQPFFLYLAFTIPHANNEAKAKGMEVPSDEPYSREPWPEAEKNKAAMISRLDADVGRLMAKLKVLKIDENTAVFFSSDNGPHKEGGIRVPMIVRWPGKIKAGTVSNYVWAFWDFLPTVAEIAGLKLPTNLDGRSVLPTLLGKKQRNHPFLYWEFHERGFKQAVRMRDWKGLRLAPDQSLELYDLKTDIGEKSNLAAQNPKIVRRIEAYLRTARTVSEHWPVKP